MKCADRQSLAKVANEDSKKSHIGMYASKKVHLEDNK